MTRSHLSWICAALLALCCAGARAQELSETAVPYDEMTTKIKAMTDYLQQKQDAALGVHRPVLVDGKLVVTKLEPTPRADYDIVLIRRMPRVVADFYGVNLVPLRAWLGDIDYYKLPVSRADFNTLEAAFAQLKADEATLTAMVAKENAIYDQEKAVLDNILAVHAQESRIEDQFGPLLNQPPPQSGDNGVMARYIAALTAAGAPIQGLSQQLSALDQQDQALIKTYQRKVFLMPPPAKAKSGSTVTPLVDGSEVFPRIDALLHDVADHAGPAGYVHISLWHCNEGTQLVQGESFLSAMRKVIQSGAEVRLTLWDSGNYGWVSEDSVDPDNKQCGDTLNKMAGRSPDGKRVYNVHVEYLKHDTLKGSYHQKYFIFNNGVESRAIAGGLNLESAENNTPAHTKSSTGGFQDVHDVAVEIDGPSVDNVEEDFAAHWYAQQDNPRMSIHTRPMVHLTSGTDQVTIAVTDPASVMPPVHWLGGLSPTSLGGPVPTVQYASPTANIKQQLLANIAKANDFIYLENYAIFDEEIISAIGKRIAQQRAAGHPLKVIILAHYSGDKDIYDFLHYITYQHLSFMNCKGFLYYGDDGEQHYVERPASGGKVWTVGPYKGDYYVGTMVYWDGGSTRLHRIISFVQDVPLYTLVVKHAGVTNSVFIHSKVSIFDDKVAGVGSANFNPRSMDRDGELTAFVEGPAVAKLRQKLWSEYFGTAPSPAQWATSAAASKNAISTGPQDKLYVVPMRPPMITKHSLDAWLNHHGWSVSVIRGATTPEDY